MTTALIQAASQFANIYDRSAMELLEKIIRSLPQDEFNDSARQVLTSFSDLLKKGTTPPLEFTVLVIHTIAYGRICQNHRTLSK